MIYYLEGNIFTSPAKVIVNTVNTDGVMGKGIALEFKKKYPEMFDYYKSACESKSLVVGRLLLWYGLDHWVLMFPTKAHWRGVSKIEYIEDGLRKFVEKYMYYGITSIAFPKLGCGNGGLDWREVHPLMEKYLKDLPISVYIYLDTYNKDKPLSGKKLEALDFTYGGLKDDILKKSMIVPVDLQNGWTAHWDSEKGVCFSNQEGALVCCNEDELLKIWDESSRKMLFLKSEEKEKDLVYELMFYLGYIDKTKIKTGDGDLISEGFQMDEGRGRRFAME